MRADAPIPTTPTKQTDKLGRRSLVRAGATAAWAVPVVAMAAPAQAATCSGGSTTLTAVKVGQINASFNKGTTTATLTVYVCNTGHSDSCALSATVTGQCESGGSKDAECTKLTSFSVGTWPGATSAAGATSLTVLAPANQQLGAGQCSTYGVTLKMSGKKGTVTLAFRTSNGGLATLTLAISGA